jgi:hypothetical protein
MEANPGGWEGWDGWDGRERVGKVGKWEMCVFDDDLI